MSFTAKWTRTARQAYDELEQAAEQAAANRKRDGKSKSSKQEGLFKQVQQSVARLTTDPKHPGLKTHEYSSLAHPFKRGEKVFEAYAQNHTPGAYRVFWCYGPSKEEITIIAITPHP